MTDEVAVAVAEGVGAVLVTASDVIEVPADAVATTLATIEARDRPRWIWWSKATATAFVEAGVRPRRCWDLGAVHRLLSGGWRSEPDTVWAVRQGLDPDARPARKPPDLFNEYREDAAPVREDGYLDPHWAAGGWAADVDGLRHWAELALDVFHWQHTSIDALPDRPAADRTARSESAAELLCAELEHDGLPIDVAEAERIIASFIGPRPIDAAHERELADERDRQVLDLAGVDDIDLRNPAGVKSLLRRVGIEVPDTRAWRLERRRGEHPVVDALLVWRRAERIATTFGYRWLDDHVGADHRLRGTWSGSDGAAGRMTATAGLHNLPAELRPAVAAEPGHLLVRADLGQIEPRILAAVSGDRHLMGAAEADDMYAPVAERLGVSREVAKVAVLGAMYGQTTGHGAAALAGLEAAYPTAMGYLAAAARSAEGGHDLRTHGGRLVRMTVTPGESGDDGEGGSGPADARRLAAARGRYGRNAMVQGAAAEFFKTWAVIVRARLATSRSTIVLALHDELLVHSPDDDAAVAAGALEDGLAEAAYRWLDPGVRVRFVADAAVGTRWSDLS